MSLRSPLINLINALRKTLSYWPQTFKWSCYEIIVMKSKSQIRLVEMCSHTCFSTCSAGHPCTCLMRFSLKCAASVGVKVHVALPEAGTEPGGIAPLTTPVPWPPPLPPLLLLLLLPMWFEAGDGLLWLLQIRNSGWVNVFLHFYEKQNYFVCTNSLQIH